MMLSADGLHEVPLLNCRPGVVAAALLYVERRLRGCAPFWPSTLARLTGVQDLNQAEASCALRAVQKLPRKNFLAALYKEQAALVVASPANSTAADAAGSNPAMGSPRSAVAAAAAAVGAGVFPSEGSKDMLLVTRTAVVAAAQAAKVAAAVPALLRMADKAVSDGAVGGGSPQAHAAGALQGRNVPLFAASELHRDPALGLPRGGASRDAHHGGVGNQAGPGGRGRENSTGRVMRNVTHSVVQPMQQLPVTGQHMLVGPAGQHHHQQQQHQGLLQGSMPMLGAPASAAQAPQQVMVAVSTPGGESYGQVQALLLPDGQLAFPQQRQSQQQLCMASEGLAAGGLHMVGPIQQQQVFTGVNYGQQQQQGGSGGGQQYVTVQYGPVTQALPTWQLPVGAHGVASYAQPQGQVLQIDAAAQQGLSSQQQFGVVELRLGGYHQEGGQLVAALEGLHLGQAAYAPTLSLGVPANAAWAAG
jgi:hypothetical protein